MGKLDNVRASMKPRPSYCCGTLLSTPDKCTLFYSTGVDDHAGYDSHIRALHKMKS